MLITGECDKNVWALPPEIIWDLDCNTKNDIRLSLYIDNCPHIFVKILVAICVALLFHNPVIQEMWK